MSKHTAFKHTLIYNHQDWTSEAGEMAKRFRALAALREDLGSVPSHLQSGS